MPWILPQNELSPAAVLSRILAVADTFPRLSRLFWMNNHHTLSISACLWLSRWISSTENCTSSHVYVKDCYYSSLSSTKCRNAQDSVTTKKMGRFNVTRHLFAVRNHSLSLNCNILETTVDGFRCAAMYAIGKANCKIVSRNSVRLPLITTLGECIPRRRRWPPIIFAQWWTKRSSMTEQYVDEGRARE